MSSPFDRGLCQNLGDLFGWKLCGFCPKSQDIDWMAMYEMDSNDDEENLLSDHDRDQSKFI